MRIVRVRKELFYFHQWEADIGHALIEDAKGKMAWATFEEVVFVHKPPAANSGYESVQGDTRTMP